MALGRAILGACLQSCYIDHDIVCRKVVEHIPQRLIAECEEASEGHCKTGKHRNASAVVRDPCKPVDGRLLQRAVDEEAVVIYTSHIRNVLCGP